MVLGLDVSSSIIGVSVVDENTKEIHLVEFINLKKEKDLLLKALLFKDYAAENLMNIGITSIAIEEPLVMYQPGFSRAQILSKLSMFNGMVSTMCLMIFDIKPVYYNVNTARKTALPGLKFHVGDDRKKRVLDSISELYPDIKWVYGTRSGKLLTENYDMADSIVISLCHSNVLNHE